MIRSPGSCSPLPKDPVPLHLYQSHSHSFSLSTRDFFLTRTFKFLFSKLHAHHCLQQGNNVHMQRSFMFALLSLSYTHFLVLYSVHEWLSSSTVIHTHIVCMRSMKINGFRACDILYMVI